MNRLLRVLLPLVLGFWVITLLIVLAEGLVHLKRH